MPRLFNYSGLVTKVKGMDANLLTFHDYEELSNLNTVQEFINFLKGQKNYAEIFQLANEHTLHRDEIERLLGLSVAKDYSKIFLFANQKQRKLLKIFFIRFEVDLLKNLVTSKILNMPLELTDDFDPFILRKSKLEIKKLFESESLEQLITVLKGTPYYDVLISLYENNTASLYEYLSRLDIYYFIHSWNCALAIKNKKDRTIILQMLGSRIDLQNILWIYRSKRFYEMSDSSIYKHIIPIHNRLSSAQMNQLVNAANLDDYLKRLEETPYKKVVSEFHKPSIDKNYIQLKIATLRKIKRKYPLSIAPILFYLYKKELEIEQLTTVLECIRYKIPSSDILNNLPVDRLEEPT